MRDKRDVLSNWELVKKIGNGFMIVCAVVGVIFVMWVRSDIGPSDGCSEKYAHSACVPYEGNEGSPESVTCAEVGATDFKSLDDDPYHLDADGDGIACETPEG